MKKIKHTEVTTIRLFENTLEGTKYIVNSYGTEIHYFNSDDNWYVSFNGCNWSLMDEVPDLEEVTTSACGLDGCAI